MTDRWFPNVITNEQEDFVWKRKYNDSYRIYNVLCIVTINRLVEITCIDFFE
jgi:hypothetical protein